MPQPAAQVGAPLIEECFANLECRVVDTSMVERYCLFVLEVIKAWIVKSSEQPELTKKMKAVSFYIRGRALLLTEIRDRRSRA